MRSRERSPSGLPDPLKKREILYSEGTPAQELIAMGRAFMDAGFPMDALDFFVEARAEAELADLLDRARRDGDLFIAGRCLAALGRRLEQEDLEALAERAASSGREAFAVRARENLGKTPPGGKEPS